MKESTERSTSNGQAVLDIIKTTVEYLRRSPSLWLLGLVTALASDGFGIVLGRALGSQLPDRTTLINQPELLAELIFRWGDQLNANMLMVLVILGGSVVVLGYLWALVVRAQAAQINIVDRLETGSQIDLKEAWRSGRPHIARLIGVDTLAFLPLFLLLLLILILLSLLLFTLILSLESSINLGENGIAAIGAAGLCIIPLLILILPTLLLTLLFRLFGARVAVLGDQSARDALRLARPWLRQNFGSALVLGLFSLASWNILGLIARVISIGLGVIKTWLPFFPFIILSDFGQIGAQMAIGTARLTLISVLWTLAYLRLKNNPANGDAASETKG